jgi:hypothetical protein
MFKFSKLFIIILQKREKTGWSKKKICERKAVHKIIMLFCLCMHFGVDEPQEVFGGPMVTAKQLTHLNTVQQERTKSNKTS